MCLLYCTLHIRCRKSPAYSRKPYNISIRWTSAALHKVAQCHFADVVDKCIYAIVKSLRDSLYNLFLQFYSSWQDFDWQRVARSVCGSRASCFHLCFACCSSVSWREMARSTTTTASTTPRRWLTSNRCAKTTSSSNSKRFFNRCYILSGSRSGSVFINTPRRRSSFSDSCSCWELRFCWL